MEQWRDVLGYEGYYQVSSIGNVVSLVRTTHRVFLAGVRKVKRKLHPSYNMQGRMIYTLCRESIPKRFQAHRLVYEAFNGATTAYVLHRDGDCLNNTIENLYADSQPKKSQSRRGNEKRTGQSKLTGEAVLEIRRSTKTQKELAAAYAVSQPTISYIIQRKTWRDVETDAPTPTPAPQAQRLPYEDLFNPR